jgi:hypothetical protein
VQPSPAWRIAAVSSIVLILELAFIRQVPAEVRVISYFTNLVLGMNLVGAMAGGVLEYTSMLTGMRAVWLMVLVLYLIAWLAYRRTREVAAPLAQ